MIPIILGVLFLGWLCSLFHEAKSNPMSSVTTDSEYLKLKEAKNGNN